MPEMSLTSVTLSISFEAIFRAAGDGVAVAVVLVRSRRRGLLLTFMLNDANDGEKRSLLEVEWRSRRGDDDGRPAT